LPSSFLRKSNPDFKPGKKLKGNDHAAEESAEMPDFQFGIALFFAEYKKFPHNSPALQSSRVSRFSLWEKGRG